MTSSSVRDVCKQALLCNSAMMMLKNKLMRPSPRKTSSISMSGRARLPTPLPQAPFWLKGFRLLYSSNSVQQGTTETHACIFMSQLICAEYRRRPHPSPSLTQESRHWSVSWVQPRVAWESRHRTVSHAAHVTWESRLSTVSHVPWVHAYSLARWHPQIGIQTDLSAATGRLRLVTHGLLLATSRMP